MVDKAVEKLNNSSYPISGYKLRIPMAVPWETADNDFYEHWANNRQCHFNHPGDRSNADHWKFYKHLLQRKREKIFASAAKAKQGVDIINLMPQGNDTFCNHKSYLIVAKWIVENADILIAVLAKDRDKESAGEWKSGGTGSTVAEWRSNYGNERLFTIDPMAKSRSCGA